jgi:hypothetical protein
MEEDSEEGASTEEEVSTEEEATEAAVTDSGPRPFNDGANSDENDQPY